MSSEQPGRGVTSIDEVYGAPSFADYMAHCLYDPAEGYYSAGRVEFGDAKHFWTYPQRLSPVFGWMVAEAVRPVLDQLLEAGVPKGVPLTILELGAGNGDLSRDVLDYIWSHRDGPRWKHLASRIRVIVGDRSAALRTRQRETLRPHLDARRAEVREIDATSIGWGGPFYGVVLANELVDAFPCERLWVTGRGPRVSRTHVDPGRGGELAVPLEIGWLSEDASGPRVDSPPRDLKAYLERIEPLVDDLDTLGLLPVQLLWAPGGKAFIEGLSALISGPQRSGAALIIDYGGTSRHVLDPRATNAHLRVYGADASLAHTAAVYQDPGRYDITWDVDFTELGQLATDAGLSVELFTHQSGLERAPIDLWSSDARDWLLARRAREGTTNIFEAMKVAHGLVTTFRAADGFRAMVLANPGLSFAHLGPGDPHDGASLVTVAARASQGDVAGALERAGIDAELAELLKPGGEIVADLSGEPNYSLRRSVIEALAKAGLLRDPGEIGT